MSVPRSTRPDQSDRPDQAAYSLNLIYIMPRLARVITDTVCTITCLSTRRNHPPHINTLITLVRPVLGEQYGCSCIEARVWPAWSAGEWEYYSRLGGLILFSGVGRFPTGGWMLGLSESCAHALPQYRRNVASFLNFPVFINDIAL